ncbi:hypothetical protein AAFF_G00373470 [Aldrovandia affinis]|uniref:Uncharacterized protein n=1 Tax=Aldrovandia affinis TaxID=143900 RepID=A0AAD7SGZ5_9TELE|nr:hypothetical protein AAFF_G00373470 [Aldrovandia affinis]
MHCVPAWRDCSRSRTQVDENDPSVCGAIVRLSATEAELIRLRHIARGLPLRHFRIDPARLGSSCGLAVCHCNCFKWFAQIGGGRGSTAALALKRLIPRGSNYLRRCEVRRARDDKDAPTGFS